MGMDQAPAYFHKTVGVVNRCSDQERESAVHYAARRIVDPVHLREVLDALDLLSPARRLAGRETA